MSAERPDKPAERPVFYCADFVGYPDSPSHRPEFP